MSFIFTQKVLFKHCDPAGIVFYPRFFEMFNDVVEAFFEAVLMLPFEELLKNHGVPTVKIDTNFSAPCRHGEILDIELSCVRLGRSSLDLNFEARCEGQSRLSAQSTLVFVDNTGKSTAWPDELRRTIEDQILGENQ